MKHAILAATLVLAGIALSAAQLPQLPSGVRGLAERIPDLDRFLGPGPVLTSGVADAVGRVGALPAGVTEGHFASLMSLPRGPRGEFLLREGNFSAVVDSFCLKAGAHAATGGDGFLAAPLKGPWAPIIEGILRNAGRIPGLKQEDVQLLLWDLLARTKVGDLPRPLQLIASQLIAPRDLVTVNGGALGLVPQRLLDLAEERLPDGVREIFAAESRIRQMVADGVSTYEEFESTAVPDAADARGQVTEVGDDQWIESPQGFFVRFLPIGYQQVRVEVIVPRASARGDRAAAAAAPQLVAIAFTPGARQRPAPALALDLPSILAMPADTGGQRLGLSSIPAADAQPTDADDWLSNQPPIAPVSATPLTATPAAPQTPVTPATPPTPATPATPQTPATPATPQTPAAPQTPATPAAPQTSATPATPSTPQTPTSPQTPPAPSTPATPQTPATPRVPTTSTVAPTAVIDLPATAAAAQAFAASGARSSAAAGRQIVRYRWQVAGRPSVETATPSFPIASPPIGKLTVTLTVVDDVGNVSAPATGSVIVRQLAAPTAVLAVTPLTVAPNQAFVMNGASSFAAAGSVVVKYRWQVEGQATETADPRRTWTSPRVGKLAVTLTVVDDAGNVSAPAAASVIVAQTTAPTAVIEVPSTVPAGQGFAANGARSSAAPSARLVKYRWHIGEISSVETDGPTLQIGPQRAGKLLVTLVVIDDAGNASAPAAGTVLVLEPR
jgi:hypothetical protein